METLTNPWVVGIGTAIIAGLILYYLFGIGKTKPKQQRLNQQKRLKPALNHLAKESLKSSLIPKEIVEYLSSLPPLQRNSAAKNYKGIKVSWKVNLEHGGPQPDGKLHLMMLNQGEYPWVYCDVDPDQYPELKIIKNDRVFLIKGEIESVEEGGITLRNCRFYF